MDGNFFDLDFWVTLKEKELEVPQRDGTMKKQTVQGFYLKGDLRLTSIDFDARFIIEVATKPEFGILVEGSIKKAIVAPATGTKLFALQDPNNTALGPHLTLQLVKDKPPLFDAACETYFLGLTSSTSISLSKERFTWKQETQFESEVLTTHVSFDISIDKIQLKLAASCSLKVSIPNAEIDNIKLPKLTIVDLKADMSTTIDWTTANWTLTVKASTMLCGADLPDLDFTVDASVQNLEGMIDYLAKKLPRALVQKAVDLGIEIATQFLQDLGAEAKDACKLLVNTFKCVRDDVVNAARILYALAEDDIKEILGELGATTEEIAERLSEWGYAIDKLIQ